MCCMMRGSKTGPLAGCLFFSKYSAFWVSFSGDWLCPDCSAHNFATKVACYRCSSPRCASYEQIAISGCQQHGSKDVKRAFVRGAMHDLLGGRVNGL